MVTNYFIRGWDSQLCNELSYPSQQLVQIIKYYPAYIFGEAMSIKNCFQRPFTKYFIFIICSKLFKNIMT